MAASGISWGQQWSEREGRIANERDTLGFAAQIVLRRPHPMLLILAATTSIRAPSVGVASMLSTSAPRSRPQLQALDDAPWRDEEDWALLDATPEFTVGAGSMAATFWTALASSSAVLSQRSSTECAQRAEMLATRQNSTLSYGQEPKVITSWSRLPDGRVTGRLDSRTVWLTVEVEGRLASDPRSGPGYIQTSGRVFELGEPAAGTTSAPEAMGGLGDELEYARERLEPPVRANL